MNELKTCPFCGGGAYRGANELDMSWIECFGCGATIIKCDSENEAITAWNRRASNIDISPERLQAICDAEREGRLVVLPVPIGSPIYVIVPEATDVDGNPIPAEIDEQHLSGYIKEGDREFYITYDPDCDILADNAYFTREEAEAALAKQKEVTRMKSEWKVTSNVINGERMYAVYRQMDVNGVDHSGNREYAGDYIDDLDIAELVAKKLNEVKKPAEAD